MFGKQFARSFFGGDWESWIPPWMQDDWPGPRFWRGFFGPWSPGHEWWYGNTPEQQALRSTAAEVVRLFAIATQSAIDNPEQQAQLRAFLERSRKELSDMIYGTSQSTNTGSSTDRGQA